MHKCEICQKPHSYNIKILFDGDCERNVCPTCFFLSAPTFNQVKSIKRNEIEKESDYSELNMYLYDMLCEKYGIVSEGSKGSTDSGDSHPSKKSGKASVKSALRNLMTEVKESTYRGREKELSDIYDILARKSKRNALIIGQPGVGKTAIVNHIAYCIKNNIAPASLRKKEIYALDTDKLIAGTKYRGDLEEKFCNLMKEIENNPNAILFVDEIQALTSRGSAEDDPGSLSGMLKPYLTGDKIQVIGTSTTAEYRKKIESDPALARRFQVVTLEEQTEKETLDILDFIAPSLEHFHGVSISHSICKSCVKLSSEYIKYRAFPDKAIDLLDMACAKKKNSMNTASGAASFSVRGIVKEAEPLLKKIPSSIDLTAILYGVDEFKDPVKACSLFLQNKMNVKDEEVQCSSALTFNDLAVVVESWTKIPINVVSNEYKEQLKTISPSIKKNLIGQDDAVDKVVSTICRRRLGVTKSNRPASFIFVGETGIGKTELAKEMAKSLFGSEKKLIRFDMSEYMESHSVAKLIGAPPGYVGYNEAGQLTEALLRNPFCVMLFDEIEKAHADVSNILLQVLDDGRITDSKGNVVDASNAIIILTSNAGATLTRGMGFGKSSSESSKEMFEKGLKDSFRPEFLGRVDDIIIFNTLSDDNYKEIAKIHLNKVISNLLENGINLDYDESVPDAICRKADTAKYHAREIRRTVTREVENLVTNKIMNEEDCEELHLITENGEIKAEVKTETSVFQM